jgi:hypothetical protein
MTDTLSGEIIEVIVMELKEYDITAEPDAKIFRPWVSVLQEVATATKGTLEYLYMYEPMYWGEHYSSFASVISEDLMEFDCIVEVYERSEQCLEAVKRFYEGETKDAGVEEEVDTDNEEAIEEDTDDELLSDEDTNYKDINDEDINDEAEAIEDDYKKQPYLFEYPSSVQGLALAFASGVFLFTYVNTPHKMYDRWRRILGFGTSESITMSIVGSQHIM